VCHPSDFTQHTDVLSAYLSNTFAVLPFFRLFESKRRVARNCAKVWQSNRRTWIS